MHLERDSSALRQGRECVQWVGRSSEGPLCSCQQHRGPKWSPSSLYLSVHSNWPCLLGTVHQRWKVSLDWCTCSPSPFLPSLCRGCRMMLSWGESASWLTPWLTKLAGLEKSPHCDPGAYRGIFPGQGHTVPREQSWNQYTQGWPSWFRAPSQHDVRGQMGFGGQFGQCVPGARLGSWKLDAVGKQSRESGRGEGTFQAASAGRAAGI